MAVGHRRIKKYGKVTITEDSISIERFRINGNFNDLKRYVTQWAIRRLKEIKRTAVYDKGRG